MGGYINGLAFDSSGNLFAPIYNYSAIYKFDLSGNRSNFAFLSEPEAIVIQVPEPATLLLFALGGLALRKNVK